MYYLPKKRTIGRVAIAGLGLALLSTSVSFSTPRAAAQIPALGPGLTIGAFTSAMNSVISNLEQSASDLLAEGNNDLAQQQLILAGTLKQTVDQVSRAYANNMNMTFDRLDQSEFNTFDNIKQLASQAVHLEGKTHDDVQGIIYNLSGASNDLLDRLPFVKRFPVFYGASAKDIMNNPDANTPDIELLGFDFTDPHLSMKPPVVKLAGRVVPASYVTIAHDRLQIQIPEGMKASIGFGQGLCNPRAVIPIDLMVYYTNSHLLGLFHSEANVTFHANAMPGAEAYTIDGTYDGVRSTTAMQSENFSNSSGSINVGCNNTASAGVTFAIPANAQQAQCNASWANMDHVKSNQAGICAITGGLASATGHIDGVDKNWVGNCPGGGHGTLTISGSYSVPVTSHFAVTKTPLGAEHSIAKDDAHITLPSDSGLQINSVNLTFRRKGCAAPYDSIAFPISPATALHQSESSANNHFVATLALGQMTISQQ